MGLGDNGPMSSGWFEGVSLWISCSHSHFGDPDRRRLLPPGNMDIHFSRPNPFRIHGSLDSFPSSIPRMPLLGANGGNICARFLWLLPDGPDSLALAREPHRANELGSAPANVSDTTRAGQHPSRTRCGRLPRGGLRSRRPDRNSFHPDKDRKFKLTKPINQRKL